MPGTFHPPENAEPTSLTLVRYSADHFEERSLHDLTQLPAARKPGEITWINVDGLGDIDLLNQLSQRFQLHPLAIEDVLNTYQRAKLDNYPDHVYVVLRMVSTGPTTDSEQVSLFLGDGWVITIQERKGDSFDPVRRRLRESLGRIRQLKADYLAYALIDAIIDGYFPAVDHYGEAIEKLDAEIAISPSADLMPRIHGMRSDLMHLRRYIRPLRDALNHVKPDSDSWFQPETRYFLRDCYDHTVQLIDLLDTYRELCANLRDYHMSVVSQRMNEVMKVLTVFGTIFMPLSFIAGVYGMNFNPALPGNMPELNWPYGYVWILVVMGVVAGGLLWFMQRKGWLAPTPIEPNGGRNGPDSHAP